MMLTQHEREVCRKVLDEQRRGFGGLDDFLKIGFGNQLFLKLIECLIEKEDELKILVARLVDATLRPRPSSDDYRLMVAISRATLTEDTIEMVAAKSGNDVARLIVEQWKRDLV